MSVTQITVLSPNRSLAGLEFASSSAANSAHDAQMHKPLGDCETRKGRPVLAGGRNYT